MKKKSKSVYAILFFFLLSLPACGKTYFEEITHPEIESLPHESELLFYQTRFSSGLVSVTLSGEVNSWEPSQQFYSAEYSWSPSENSFSIWGKNSDTDTRNLYLVSLNNSTTTIIGQEPYPTDCEHEWSPDGSQIAFPDLGETRKNPYSTDIFIQDKNNTNSNQITFLPYGSVHNISWSPDGTKIAFSYSPFKKSDNQSILYVINLNNDMLSHLPKSQKGYISSVQWSPDGKKIAYLSSNGTNTPYSLWIITLEGYQSQLLFEAPNEKDVSAFAWSPDSKKIAFISDYQGQCKTFLGGEGPTISEYTLCGKHIYILDLVSQKTTRITNKIICYSPIRRLFWIKIQE